MSSNIKIITSSFIYEKIPEYQIAYWISSSCYKAFQTFDNIGNFGNTKKGVLTGNDAKFVRLWFEISTAKMGRNITSYNDMLVKNYKWIPSTGGGIYRKWYGNFENVINMENDSFDIRNNTENSYRLRETLYYFKECSTWSEVSGRGLSMRYVPKGILFGNSGPVCFWNSSIYYWIAFLNSKVSMEFLTFLSPTLTFGPEQIKRIPANYTSNYGVDELSERNIDLSKLDWDSFETSWDFKKHPLI